MRASAAALLLAAITFASSIHAWTDARPAGLVTELQVERDGNATVALRVRWRVLAGPPVIRERAWVSAVSASPCGPSLRWPMSPNPVARTLRFSAARRPTKAKRSAPARRPARTKVARGPNRAA